MPRRLLRETQVLVESVSATRTHNLVQNEVSPLTIYAAIAQLVERFHGKEEVSGSNPDRGSIEKPPLVTEVVFLTR